MYHGRKLTFWVVFHCFDHLNATHVVLNNIFPSNPAVSLGSFKSMCDCLEQLYSRVGVSAENAK